MPAFLLSLFVIYLALMLAVALLAERRRGPTRHPIILALALSTYVSGWGYFGTGAYLLSEGLPELGMVIGGSLAVLLGWPLVSRVWRLAQTYRLTTLPGLMALRFGQDGWFQGTMALLLVLSLLPYLALQLEAISLAAGTLVPTAPQRPPVALGLGLTALMAGFAIAVGARRADPTRRHVGIVAALALDGLVKLVCLLVVMLVVVWQHPELPRLTAAMDWPTLVVGTPANHYPNWLALMGLGAMSFWTLPRIFHLGFVESQSEADLRAASHGFLALLWALTALPIAIAIAGRALGLAPEQLTFAAMHLGAREPHAWLAAVAFLGGASAAAAMMLATLVATGNMLVLDVLLPLLSPRVRHLGPLLLPVRWAAIALIAALAFGVWRITHVTHLTEFGFLAMGLTAQFGPPLLLGLTSPRLTRGAAIGGLAVGLVVWGYTAYLPVLVAAMPGGPAWLAHGPAGLAWARPTALLGVEGLNPYAHAAFWSLGLNLLTLLLANALRPASTAENDRVTALIAGQGPSFESTRTLAPISYEGLEALLAEYIGPRAAHSELTRIRAGAAHDDPSRMLIARREAERVLAGPLGIGVAERVMQARFPLTGAAMPEVLEAYQALEQDLMLSRQQLDATIANLDDAVFVLDRTGKTLLVNDAFVRLLEAPDKAWIYARNVREVIEAARPRPLDADTTEGGLPTLRTLASGRISHGSVRMTGLNGTERVVSISSTPILDGSGALAQVVTVYRDVTELYNLKEALEARVVARTHELADERDQLRRTNEKLEAAVGQLRDLDAVKGRFINAISHDLRIPLTGIVGYAEFLEEGLGGDPAQQREYAVQILHAAARMTGLLNDLLDFARMEAGKFKIDAQPMPIQEAVTSAVDLFRPALARKEMSLELALPPDLPWVMADPERVAQMMSNLISNALKFTPAGGRLSIRARAAGGFVEIEVADTGVGMTAEEQRHLFERFYQTEAGRRAGGTGLGLSITKSLVEAHGGTISASSTPGQGTTFRFTLPVAPSEASQ